MPNNGPFTDDMVRHYVKVVKTQHGILEAVEVMAKVLAEMGRASRKAVGDSPVYAIARWTDLIKQRANEILQQDGDPNYESPMRKKLQCELQKHRKKLPSPST